VADASKPSSAYHYSEKVPRGSTFVNIRALR